MTRSVYVASPEGLTGKSAVALGLLDALTREVGSVGIFRPLTTVGATGETDLVVDLLVNQPGIQQTYEEALGVTYEAARENADEALHQIVERFGQLTDRFEVIVVVGSDYADVSSGTELSFNAKIAANLGSPVVLVVHGRERTPEQIRAAADSALAELRANHAQTVAVIANRVEAEDAAAIRKALADLPDMVTAAVTENPMLSAPTFRALVEAADGELVLGSEAWMDRESLGLIVAAMSLPNVLDRLSPDVTVIAPSDRTDLIPGLMLAHQSGTFPGAGRHPADRRVRDPGHHPATVGGGAAGPADRADRPGHLRHRRAAAAGPRADDVEVGEQDRSRPGGCSPSRSTRPPCWPRSTCRRRRCARR